MADTFEPALKGAHRPTRYILKTVPKLGSGVYTVGKILGAENKPRAILGAVGGWVGGALGAAAGPAAGIAVPLGAAVGSAVGEELAEDIYDDHHEAVRRKMEDTKRWMKQR